jgi:hypothetical protein
MTLQEAKTLKAGDTVYHTSKTNADGTAMRARVTSIKTWKRSPESIAVKVKRGLYEYAVFDQMDIHLITMTEPIY